MFCIEKVKAKVNLTIAPIYSGLIGLEDLSVDIMKIVKYVP